MNSKDATQTIAKSTHNVYEIVKQLRTYKGTQSACLLILSIDIEGLWGTRLTKAICRELLGCNPDASIRILKQSNVIDFNKGELSEPDFNSLIEPREEETPSTKFSWKYGRNFHSSFKSYGPILEKFAAAKRYPIDEYFDKLMDAIRKDSWWKNVITEEMALRKIELLEKKFGHCVPNKIGSLDSISHIF